MALTIVAVAMAAGGTLSAEPLRLESPALSVVIGEDGRLEVTHRLSGRVWRQLRVGPDPLEPGAPPVPVPATPGAPAAARFGLALPGFCPAPAYTPTPAPTTVEITLALDQPDLTVRLTLPRDGLWHAVRYPLCFASDAADPQLLFPHAEGILLPLRADVPGFVPVPYADIHGGLSCYCACLGILDDATGGGVLTAFDTPELAAFELHPTPAVEGLNLPRLVFRASKHCFDRDRVLTFSFAAEGGYVALARHYQRHVRRWGWSKSLADKALDNPEAARLAGAPIFWVAGEAEDVLAVASALHADGVDRAVINIAAPWWNKPAGHEDKLQRLAAVIPRIRGLGFLVSRYDQYRDAFAADDKASLYNQINCEVYPDGLVRQEDGSIRPGWPPGAVINPEVSLELARQRITADQAAYGFNARFIDCVGTCAFWEGEDWNPKRPLDTYGTRAARERLLQYATGQKLVVGTEGGIDCLLPWLHWLETPMSLVRWTADSLPLPGWLPMPLKPEYALNLDPRRRVPFFSLVHHAEVISTWRWEDGLSRLPEHWQTKNLFTVLYGGAPMFFVDRQHFEAYRAQIVHSCRYITGWTRGIAFEEMLSHRSVSPDRMVQQTVFGNGRGVVVNFGPASHPLPDGSMLPALSYRTFATAEAPLRYQSPPLPEIEYRATPAP